MAGVTVTAVFLLRLIASYGKHLQSIAYANVHNVILNIKNVLRFVHFSEVNVLQLVKLVKITVLIGLGCRLV